MMWDHLPIEKLIEQNVPPYGLAPERWRAQLVEIRELPEIKPKEKR